MKYSLKQISVFDAIASEQSVSAAARKLSMTQSAVSMSLSQLESLLGRPLFTRQGNRLVLSHWGHWLRPRARKLLQDAKQIELGLHDQHLLSGKLGLGVSQTVAEHIMPNLIASLDQHFPELRLSLTVENSDQVIQGLLSHDYDLGIIEGRCDDSRMNYLPWIEDRLVVVASPHHAYCSQAEVTPIHLQQAQWVMREHGAGTRRVFNAAIHGVIDKVNVWKEYSQTNVLKALVKRGGYLSALPWLDVEKEVTAGELVVLATPSLKLERRLGFVWRQDAPDNPLRDVVVNEAKRLAR
ncbi:LysR substrate-binding domain-containing protein [Shewanella submarina]|uniref:LysR family transcriptional regulator n=1 Tax=Shewanella submarina TaxID=2016376 RepID=A0ABV7GG58_9GAMM|nr:LysR substrate-binding domain-containing protein [Shewanella submarina]MCL1036588.1 LysR substrate-binding domain-containing protein [Shewanella submarina]